MRLGLPALAAVALAVAAAAMLLATDSADAQFTEVVIEVKPSTEQQQAAVTDLESDNVTFELSITVTRSVPLPFNPITITPRATVVGTAGWEAVFTPHDVKFNGSGSEDFLADIIVPANLSADRIFTVDFNATVEGVLIYNLVHDTGLVEILPYYKIGRTFSTETHTYKQGDRASLDFTITNRGNGDDNIAIALEDASGLQLRGITIQYPDTQRLEPWQSAKVQFFIDIASDAPAGTAQVNFTLRSQGSGGKVTSSVQFTVQVEKTVLRVILSDYWWALALLVVVLIVAVLVVRGRRRRRREDDEALEYLKRKEARRQAAPEGQKAVAGSGAREAPTEDEPPRRPEPGQDASGGPGAEDVAEEAVEVEVGTEVGES